MKKKLLFGIGLVTASVVCMWVLQPKTYQVTTQAYQQILDEVMSVDFPFRYLTPDASGTTLAYVHEAEQGRGLYFMDLKTKQRQLAAITNEVTKMFAWSPDDRYLAFAQTPPNLPEVRVQLGNAWSKEEWLTIYDRETKEFRRLTRSKNCIESRFVWLTTNSYFFVSRDLAKTNGEAYIGSLRSTEPTKVSDYDAVMDSFVLVRDNVVAYTDKGEVWELDLSQCTNSAVLALDKKASAEQQTPVIKPVQISHMRRTRGFPALQWLRYDQNNKHFLFCARPKDADWRYLYRWDPEKRRIYQNSTEDTYNGQFIQDGNGVAFVRNSNFVFSLTIKPKRKVGSTNLFANGGVSSYAVAPSGDRVYMAAWEGLDPASIWEYDIKARKLCMLASGFNKPFVTSQVIVPKEGKIKTSDGLEVPYFLYAPLPVVKQEKMGEKPLRLKYPAVIYVPPSSAAVNWSYNARMQLLANLGFYVMAINYHGCEGYGVKYANSDPSLAVKDVLAGYELLLQESKVDKKRIFLSSDSRGSLVVNACLTSDPKRWRAVTMENPVPIDFMALNANDLPPVFFTVGDQDSGFEELEQFRTWATENGAPVTSYVYTNSGHVTFKTEQRKDKLDRVARFIISNL